MNDFIANATVARSLIQEALSLLDHPDYASAAAHLRKAINDLAGASGGAGRGQAEQS